MLLVRVLSRPMFASFSVVSDIRSPLRIAHHSVALISRQGGSPRSAALSSKHSRLDAPSRPSSRAPGVWAAIFARWNQGQLLGLRWFAGLRWFWVLWSLWSRWLDLVTDYSSSNWIHWQMPLEATGVQLEMWASLKATPQSVKRVAIL